MRTLRVDLPGRAYDIHIERGALDRAGELCRGALPRCTRLFVVTDSNVTIDGVSRSMTESTVYATAKTEEGGSVQYRISMVRDGITWKVSNVELYFPSQA